jgi:nitroreductase
MPKKEYNPVLKAIKERRSIRYYKPDSPSKELIEKVIDAGNWAPSAGNLQPWRFVLIEEKNLRGRLSELALPKWKSVMETLKKDEPERYEIHSKHMDRKDPVCYSAPVILFVIRPSITYCSLACENMMLVAHSLGLGCCYVGWGALVIEEPEAIEILDLKKGENVIGPIVLGYPEKYPKAPHKKEAKVKWI